VAIRVFPVDATGSPHFADDFGYVRPGATRGHQGIDIFAGAGTPVRAVDDGAVRFAEDPLGGHALYLTAQDGTVYYGAHLSGYEGAAPRPVVAGEVLGYVGTTGNAQGTSPHLHFEAHPAGGAAVDPYAELRAVAPQGATGTSSSSASSPPPLSLVAKGLVAAYTSEHPSAAPPHLGLLLAVAWSLVEGAWSPYFAGTNNYGSIHATSAWATQWGQTAGYGMVAFLDHHTGLPGAGPGGALITRMRVYPSLQAGAAEFLQFVERAVDLGAVASAHDFAAGLYASGYYGGFHPKDASEPARTPVADRPLALAMGLLNASDAANIADGESALTRWLGKAQAAVDAAGSDPGDPAALSVGPPFASLAERLTPGPALAPHTLEHARQLLGAAADAPPAGAISLADALASPSGDGVWLFGPAGATPTPPPPGKGQGTPVVAQPGGFPVLATFLGAVAGVVIGAGGVVLARRWS
jgi:hypothetical protein